MHPSVPSRGPRRLPFLALVALAALSLAAGAAARDLDAIQKSGKLVVGLEPAYQPFEMKTAKGELIGFDVELARRLGKELGVQVAFKELDWDGIIPALLAGDVDCILSGMSITEERKKRIAFSDPYYKIGQAVLVNIKDKEKVKSWKDLDRKGWVVTTQLGTTGEQAAKKLLKNATIKTFEKVNEAALEVQSGRAAGLIFDNPFIAIYAKRQKEHVHAILDTFTTEDIGIALSKKSPKLLEALNKALAAAKKDGTAAALEKKYFVEMPWLGEVKG